MAKAGTASLIDQARSLLEIFRTASDSEVGHHADDILSYFRLLHESYAVRRSSSPRFSGKTFIILEEVIYQLESDPDATLRNEGFRDFILLVLEDIVQRRIDIVPKAAAQL